MYREVEALMKTGAWEEARAECASLCLRYLGHAQAHAYHGLCLFRLERFDEAAEELRKAATLDPDHYDATVKLAQSLDRLARYEDAYEVVKAFLPKRPDDPTLVMLAKGLEEFVPKRITDGWEKSVRLDHRVVELAGEEEVILPEGPEPESYGPRRQ